VSKQKKSIVNDSGEMSIKFSPNFFIEIAKKIPEIKFLVPYSEEIGSVTLYVYLENGQTSIDRVAEELIEKADLHNFWCRKDLQIIFLESSAVKVIGLV
jgi:hypothetical protein